ncbi:MAG TPA: ADP-ribosylation factor-like protein [Candidatus Lokiarchaeia archaeon]|nr:ADP-ribosylation factor-like protein [Candidatus Lokiarchaeia archaeon]
MEESTEAEQKKILIMGLDNSGKTSIILALKGNRNLLSFYSLKPTFGVNVEKILNDEGGYFIWDFGGQEQFRSKYLEDFPRYAEYASRIIFVFDIQDVERIPEAINYLKDVLQCIGDFNLQVSLDVFLHKYDPSIEMLGDEKVEAAVQNLTEELKTLIPSDLSYRLFKTTIYTVFRQTLIEQ